MLLLIRDPGSGYRHVALALAHPLAACEGSSQRYRCIEHREPAQRVGLTLSDEIQLVTGPSTRARACHHQSAKQFSV